MPQFIRRRDEFDWLTPPAIRHLSAEEQHRLIDIAKKESRKGRNRFGRAVLGAYFIVFVIGAFTEEKLIPLAKIPPVPPLLKFLGGLGILMSSFAILVFIYVYQKRIFDRALRAQMLADGIRPCYCFDCGYYTEGFQGNDCPNCGAALVTPNTASSP